MSPVHELDRLPSIVTSFTKAVRPGRRPAGLPELELGVRSHRLDPANLAAYQRLCGFDVSASVPATYVHVQAFALTVALMADRSFPLPLLGLLHVQNQMTQLRAVQAADQLELRVWAADLREHPAGRQVDLHAETRVGDELVWTGASTYLHREGGGESNRKPRAVTEPVVADALWRLAKDLGRRYAAISGDRNPIHLSSLSARAFGFPRPIVHGMWLHARALASIAPRLPSRYRVEGSFKTPALLPSTVAFRARPGPDEGWTLAVSAARSGKPHFAATVHGL